MCKKCVCIFVYFICTKNGKVIDFFPLIYYNRDKSPVCTFAYLRKTKVFLGFLTFLRQERRKHLILFTLTIFIFGFFGNWGKMQDKFRRNSNII